MAYRRGFKSEANEIARDVRDELGLQQLDRLDPNLLARHLAVPILPLSQLRSLAEEPVEYLLCKEPEAFSAVTVFCGSRRTIVHNDAHSRGRQSSNVTHELAHALLLHDPSPPLDHRGCRIWDPNIEDEAQWLAGALLITEEAALWIVRGGMSGVSAAEHFGVSEKMVIYRTNVTGARRRVARARGLRALR